MEPEKGDQVQDARACDVLPCCGCVLVRGAGRLIVATSRRGGQRCRETDCCDFKETLNAERDIMNALVADGS